MILNLKEKLSKIGCKQNGFTLFEAFLAVGVSAAILLAGVQVSDRYASDIADQKEAQFLTQVMDYAEEYASENFEYIWSNPNLMNEGFNDNSIPANGTFEIADGDDIRFDRDGNGIFDNLDIVNINRVVKLGILNPIAGNPGDFFLRDLVRGTMPVGFSANVPAGQPMRTELGERMNIMIRNLGYISGKRALEVILITETDPGEPIMSHARINNIASYIGSEAGAWGSIDPNTRNAYVGGFCGPGNVNQSINQTWQLSANQLTVPFAINPNNSYCPANVPPAVPMGKSYIALRRVVEHEEEYIPNVVYRNDIVGRPELARMQANLNMRSNVITNANAMSADRLIVDENFNVNSDASRIFVEETGRFAGPDNRISANPTAPAAAPGRTCRWLPGPPRSLDPIAAGNCDLVGGNLLIQAENLAPGTDAMQLEILNANAAEIVVENVGANITRVSGDVQINGALNIANVSTGNAIIEDLVVTNNVVANNVVTDFMDVTNMATLSSLQSNTVITDDINAQDMHVQGGDMGVLGTSRVNGDMNVSNNASITTLNYCRSNMILRSDLNTDGFLYQYGTDLQRGVPTYNCKLGPP